MKVSGKFIKVMILLLVFILFAQGFGIFFHVGQKVLEIDARDPNDTLRQVIGIFLKENSVSLILSGGILLLDMFIHTILYVYSDIPSGDVIIPIVGWVWPYEFVALVGSFVLGYGGQRGFYWGIEKIRAAAKKKLEGKIDL